MTTLSLTGIKCKENKSNFYIFLNSEGLWNFTDVNSRQFIKENIIFVKKKDQ